MRYRPLGATGLSVSALTLVFPDGELDEAGAYRLACSALEHGVNSFEFAEADATAASAMRQVIGSVGRKLLVLSLRLDASAAGGAGARVREAARASQAEPFDVVMLPRPDPRLAEALRRERFTRMVGVEGDDDTLDLALRTGGVEALAAPYSMRSGWPERNRIKAAVAQGVSVIGRDFHVAEPGGNPNGRRGLARLFRRSADAGPDPYAFLKETPGWTAEQIGLAFALSEPALATVQVRTASLPLVQQLAQAVDRELPPGLSAQIEIARFAALGTPDAG
jgi:aryl-alcohol dehydrogenase-like predicted oxidoreductase